MGKLRKRECHFCNKKGKFAIVRCHEKWDKPKNDTLFHLCEEHHAYFHEWLIKKRMKEDEKV